MIVFCQKVPGQGWAQIVAFLGTYELFINKPAPCLQSADRVRNIDFCKGVPDFITLRKASGLESQICDKVGDEPGNYGKGNLGLGFLGPVADPEARKKKLSAELANGRLAMMAIIGMLLSRRYSFEL